MLVEVVLEERNVVPGWTFTAFCHAWRARHQFSPARILGTFRKDDTLVVGSDVTGEFVYVHILIQSINPPINL